MTYWYQIIANHIKEQFDFPQQPALPASFLFLEFLLFAGKGFDCESLLGRSLADAWALFACLSKMAIFYCKFFIVLSYSSFSYDLSWLFSWVSFCFWISMMYGLI